MTVCLTATARKSLAKRMWPRPMPHRSMILSILDVQGSGLNSKGTRSLEPSFVDVQGYIITGFRNNILNILLYKTP